MKSNEKHSMALKDLINKDVLKAISNEIKIVYPDFLDKDFLKVTAQLESLELKARVILVAYELQKYLPIKYTDAVKILVKVMRRNNLSGFALWPFSEFIALFGLKDFDVSMKAMYELTQKFTSEFAVRPYFLSHPEKVLSYFNQWVTDSNVHVRRWISEGSRPLLPWGAKLSLFVEKPEYTFPLLEQLKLDDELYVRKSVANHLNDISKYHPEKVIKMMIKWGSLWPSDQIEKWEWIKKQALRTLIKKGDPRALKLMGAASKAKVKVSRLKLNQKEYHTGDSLEFSFEISSEASKKQKLVVDYIITFVKANGKTNKKVFKLKTFDLKSKEVMILKKKHSLRPITTMKYYSGQHSVAIQINGQIWAQKNWYFLAEN